MSRQPKDENNNAIPILPLKPGGGQKVTVAAGSARSTAVTTQDDIYLFTQDGRGIEMNQDVIDAFQSITTQDGIQLFTQNDRELVTNQNLVDDFPGLLSQDGLEFITQDGRHLLTNVRD